MTAPGEWRIANSEWRIDGASALSCVYYSLLAIRRFCAELGAQRVDRGEPAPGLHVPEGPAVAGFEPLRDRADAVDRADHVAERDRAVRAHQGGVASSPGEEPRAGSDEPALDERRERNARRFARGLERLERRLRQRRDRRDALLRRARVTLLAFDADEGAAEAFGHRAGRAGAEERVEHQVARTRGGERPAREERLDLLRGMNVGAVLILE